jgi:hypothetical protein
MIAAGLITGNQGEPGTIQCRGQPSPEEECTCRRTASRGTCHGFEDKEEAIPGDIELFC